MDLKFVKISKVARNVTRKAALQLFLSHAVTSFLAKHVLKKTKNVQPAMIL